MRNTIKTAIIIVTVALLASSGFAEEKNIWEQEFVQSLQKAKIIKDQKSGGLGYTLDQEEAEELALKNAIQKAMDLKAPPCSAMKIAVDLKYKPYSVIKNVFASGGEVDLDQMCMCATEKGVTKQIIAQAAKEAQFDGKPVFMPDEVTQAQCLQEVGLGYQTESVPFEPIPPPKPPISVSSPS